MGTSQVALNSGPSPTAGDWITFDPTEFDEMQNTGFCHYSLSATSHALLKRVIRSLSSGVASLGDFNDPTLPVPGESVDELLVHHWPHR